jgi:predicted pyridoxine 5'-phosphate oxidase superfamily flavin-nucleotide-binding protein
MPQACPSPRLYPATRTESNGKQQRLIREADTFFIASSHRDGGADASHRGGNPGFVHVLNETKLIWPDYSGNGMFQTLGNLAIDPRAGLLFMDFESGARCN